MAGDTAISDHTLWTFARIVALVATSGAPVRVVWLVIAVHDVLLATPILVVLTVLAGMLYLEDMLGEAIELP